jgi:hypothetical protein
MLKSVCHCSDSFRLPGCKAEVHFRLTEVTPTSLAHVHM